MPIDFRCPHCGVQMNVADQYAGQTGSCATCGRAITIPGPGGGFVPSPPARSGGWIATVAIVLGVVGVCFVGVVVLLALFFPAVQAARETARQNQCANNLRQISMAMISYHEAWGSLPPAYIADANGRPMHSWRVLILPYMEGQHLHDQYNFDEPWDGPNNSRLQAMMPSSFACPSEGAQSAKGITTYMAVIGERTAFPGDRTATFSSMTDGRSVTLLVVESTESVNWMEPRDLDFDLMSFAVNDPGGFAIGSHHPDTAKVSTADGSVHTLVKGTDPTVVKRLVQKDDGEAVSLDF
jgi:hypothetical protein